jgi:hypothetical protein
MTISMEGQEEHIQPEKSVWAQPLYEGSLFDSGVRFPGRLLATGCGGSPYFRPLAIGRVCAHAIGSR